MISYTYNTPYALSDESIYSKWLESVALSEEASIEELSYIFVSDDELYDMNVKYLKHNTLTDIITFNYGSTSEIAGDVFISVDRVAENAKTYSVSETEEMLRVLAHGLLHLLGYNDKTDEDQKVMTLKEDEKIKMFHVEQ